VSVDLVSPWETYHWSSYDAIHAFSIGHYLSIVPQLRDKGARRIVLSPIYDSNRAETFANLLSRLDLPVGEMRTIWATLRATIPHVHAVLVRSDFEAGKIASIFGVQREKIVNVPLPVRFGPSQLSLDMAREPICSHVSILSAASKNVDRLIQAAVKYRFPLHLAGRIKDERFRTRLDSLTGAHPNVVYHGPLSDDDLKKLYGRSRVFALPSLMEGVGLVGLEAAAHGADIVITGRGGPKEYYGGLARTVDPESVDGIGQAVMGFLDGQTFQPELSQRILAEYSIEASVAKLIDVYRGHD
jgi:glycosyltransferase involved in cell wall biosynthesis